MSDRLKYFAEIEGQSLTIQSLIWTEQSKARTGSFSFELWDPSETVVALLKPSKIFDLWIGFVDYTDWDTTVKDDLDHLSGIIIMPERILIDGKMLYSVEGVDRSAVAHNYIVNKAYSSQRPDQIAEDAWTNFGPSGITFTNVSTAPRTIESIQYPHDTLFQVMEELADFAGWSWRIDADDDLHFGAATDDYFGELTEADMVYGTVKFKDDSTQLANRVWVFGAFVESDDITETFVGNDEQHTFKLAYSPIFETVAVTRGGVGQTVGVDGVDTFTSHNVLVNTTSQVLRFDPSSPPSSASLVAITYKHGWSVISRREDAASIAEYGLHEHVIVDAKIRSNVVAAEIARAHLNEYGWPSRQAEMQITRASIRAGQTVRVTHTGYSVDRVYTVDQVDRELRGPEDAIISIKLRASPGIVTIDSKVRELDQRIHALETKDIPAAAPVNTYQSMQDDLTLDDTLTADYAAPESRVGYALVGYSQIYPLPLFSLSGTLSATGGIVVDGSAELTGTLSLTADATVT
jgi:hypothetical protein